jgi:dTMP kinase
MNGFFITFEGIEGSGKTSQIKMLKNYLAQKGCKVYTTKEPGGTPLGEKIRKILLQQNKNLLALTELFLFLVSRIEHTKKIIVPLLKKGYIILCDRYADSSIAYQGYGRKIDLNLIHKLNKFATFNVTPNITFIIDLPVEKGIKRIINRNNNKLDRIENEKLSFHKKVKHGFLTLAKQNKKRIFILNGNKSKIEIHKEIVEILYNKLWKIK